MMKFFALFSIYSFFVFFSFFVKAQNLVPNPGFEQISDCDLYFDEFGKAKNWKGYNFTPDLFNACSSSPYLSVPNNVYDTQAAASGKGYAGILTYHKDYKNELIGIKLTQPIKKGEKYAVSFKVSLAAAHSQFASNNLGVVFSNYPEKTFNSNLAHIYTGDIIKESDIWKTIYGIFEADQDYLYLVIGNFFDKNRTRIEKVLGGTFAAAYYFIDDVSVINIKDKNAAYVSNKNTGNQDFLPDKPENIKGKTITLSGNVFDAETRKPLVASVAYSIPDTKYKQTDETDLKTGYYTFLNVLNPNTFILQISARNYYPITQYVQNSEARLIKKDFYLQVLKAGQHIELQNIAFQKQKSNLKPESFPELNKLISILKDNPTLRIQLLGYTPYQESVMLAQNRAKSVMEYLITIGKINSDNLSFAGFFDSGKTENTGAAAGEKKELERIEFKILN